MSEIPSEVKAAAAKQMLYTIYAERAKLQIQKVTNAHTDAHPSGVTNLTYAQREQELVESEERLRAEYGDLLT